MLRANAGRVTCSAAVGQNSTLRRKHRGKGTSCQAPVEEEGEDRVMGR